MKLNLNPYKPWRGALAVSVDDQEGQRLCEVFVPCVGVSIGAEVRIPPTAILACNLLKWEWQRRFWPCRLPLMNKTPRPQPLRTLPPLAGQAVTKALGGGKDPALIGQLLQIVLELDKAIGTALQGAADLEATLLRVSRHPSALVALATDCLA